MGLNIVWPICILFLWELLLKENATVVATAGLLGKLANLTLGGFIAHNLIPVTLGNIMGGASLCATYIG